MPGTATPAKPKLAAREVFADMFKRVNAPVLPAAISRLLTEMNSNEPDLDKLEMIISAEQQISARVLRTINSSQFALRDEVRSVRHAMAMLGLNRIRSILLSYAMLDALPKPTNNLFKHEMFWTDTLLRGLLARELTERWGKYDPEEAFTAMLLADVSVPVLLVSWEQDYAPIISQWDGNPKELCHLEREAFGWDHARASAWVLKHWNFPDELVNLVATHNLEPAEIEKRGLQGTLVEPVNCAALLPSSIKPLEGRCYRLVRTARKTLGIDHDQWPDIIGQLREQYEAICEEFGLNGVYALEILEVLRRTAGDLREGD